MGHQAKRKSRRPSVKHRGDGVTVARTNGEAKGVSCRPSGISDPQPGPLAGLNERIEQIKQRERDFRDGQRKKGSTEGLILTDAEWDSLFCMAVKHHFEQEQVWVPSVLRTMALLEGINDKTGRPCRIYVRPNRHLVMIETLS